MSTGEVRWLFSLHFRVVVYFAVQHLRYLASAQSASDLGGALKFRNIALILAIVLFAIGYIPRENIVVWLGKPLGAVLFIIYFIMRALEKESRKFDDDARSHR